MLYLEDLLKTLNSKVNVIVSLSSYTDYGIGPENKVIRQDCCGNHHTENWLGAIEDKHLEKRFIVKDVKVSFENYMNSPQWEVILTNEKSHITKVLDVESNQQAIMRSFL